MCRRSTVAIVACLTLLSACVSAGGEQGDTEIGRPADLAFDADAVAHSSLGATETAPSVPAETAIVEAEQELMPDAAAVSDVAGDPIGADGVVDTLGDDPELDSLWERCEVGDEQACDELFFLAPVGSDYEAFANACGGRRFIPAGACAIDSESGSLTPTTPAATGDGYGDNPGFDALWNACAAGRHDACDDLWTMSPGGSSYEVFASTCGGITFPADGLCSQRFGTPAGKDSFSQGYGDDAGLDAVHDACLSWGGIACDVLYRMSPTDSDYESLALTCGGRRDTGFAACA
jgi:hypothetical protein